MIFHTFAFVVFFAAVLLAYWRLGRRQQNVLLLAASYFFYGFVHPWFVGLLFFTTVVDYLAGLGIGRFPGRRKALLALSLASNLGVLGFFKYFGFFAENVVEAGSRLGLSLSRPELDILLPVGLSFYTFQSLSYTIDVYRGTLQPRRDFLEFATFLALFPQLVAGPIERAAHMLPQVERPRSFDPDRARGALVLMAWGFFKKLVVADNVALIANRVFTLDQPGLALLGAGTLAFCVQIYADFSAYSDIAIGSARLLGLELMKNFDHPYLAETPREFWRRWHISLSSWFRDYVYVPLGGNRVSPLRHRVNLMASFLLSGLWHGASWNFVLWGAYHGFLLLVYQAVDRAAPFLVRARALAVPRVALFFVLTNIGWLLFRETEAARLLGYLALRPGADSADQLLAARYFLGLVLVYAFPLVVDSVLSRTRVYRERGPRLRHALVEGAAVAVLVVGMTFLHSDQPSDFIYFQF